MQIIVQLENSDRRPVNVCMSSVCGLHPRNTVNAEAADSWLQNMWLEKTECIRSLALNDICFCSSTQASGSPSDACFLFVVHFLGQRPGRSRYRETDMVSHDGTQPLWEWHKSQWSLSTRVTGWGPILGSVASLFLSMYSQQQCAMDTHTRPIQKEALEVYPPDWKSFICSAWVVKYFIYKTEMQAKFKGDNSYVGDSEDNVLCTKILKQGVFSQGVPQRYLQKIEMILSEKLEWRDNLSRGRWVRSYSRI